MKTTEELYDVAIIGSGIAGSTLGTILARHGLKVIIFEAHSHPKFAIGESMILETSETMRAIATLYDVPELAFYSSETYLPWIGTSHGVKRHFSYLYHQENKTCYDLNKTLQAVIPKDPYGHELHIYRQDSDYFLTAVAVRYGATVLQNTRIQDIEIDHQGVDIRWLSTRENLGRIRASYVVDAGGYRSILAEKFGLRDHNLQTHSRAIFTHMLDVPCYHQVSASKADYGIPFRLSEGTLHHLFKGGWLWVIPFDNHACGTNPLCSVGLMLDPRIHPQPANVSPEAEFYSFLDRYLTIQAQFRQAKPVRDWTRTGRIQYTSKRIVGDRFCLLGHAAGFIDPLFSKGLYTALFSVSVLANRLLSAQKTGDYSTNQFLEVEDITQSFIQTNDRLIANAYKAFSHYPLWSVYSVLWLLGAYLELVKLTSARAQVSPYPPSDMREQYYHQVKSLNLVGGGFPAFDALAQQVYTILEQTDLGSETKVHQATEQIYQLLMAVPWLPGPFRDILNGKNHLPVNKIRPSLLRPKQGFLGNGQYREHFFGRTSLSFVIQFFITEKARMMQQKFKWLSRQFDIAA
ncbi:MAG: NAD(P)/FAD-dependent oxidoreductase [Cyanobacteria bacterium P01_G01_bin.38]